MQWKLLFILPEQLFFPLLLTSILGLMTYWWVFGLTAWNSFSGTQRSSPTLSSHATGEQSTDSEWIPWHLFHNWPFQPLEELDSLCKGSEVAFGSAVVKSGSCSEGNVEVTGLRQLPQHWGLSARHSQVAASFDQEGSEVFGLLNLWRNKQFVSCGISC